MPEKSTPLTEPEPAPVNRQVFANPRPLASRAETVMPSAERIAAMLEEPGERIDLSGADLRRDPVLLVGHQPTLGQTIARLLGLRESDCPVKKGAIWWLRSRERDGVLSAVVVTVQSPELL